MNDIHHATHQQNCVLPRTKGAAYPTSIRILHDLGLCEATASEAAWPALEQWATMNEAMEESRFETIGGSPMRTLRHELHLPDARAAAKLHTTVPLEDLSLAVQGDEQLTETLPDRRLTLVGPCLCTTMELTKRTSALIVAAAHFGGRYEGYQEVWDLKVGDAPGVVRTNLANWPAVSAAAQAAAPRHLKARTECMQDAMLVRALLAPWTISWKDNDSLSMLLALGPATRIGADREIEVELTPDAPCVDHLAWMLNQVPDLHVAAESLTRAERYTGRRLPGGLIERMAPPTEERQALVERLGALHESLQMMVESVEAARDAVRGTLPRVGLSAAKAKHGRCKKSRG